MHIAFAPLMYSAQKNVNWAGAREKEEKMSQLRERKISQEKLDEIRTAIKRKKPRTGREYAIIINSVLNKSQIDAMTRYIIGRNKRTFKKEINDSNGLVREIS